MSGQWIKPALIGVDGARPFAFGAPVDELLQACADDDAAVRYARGAAAMAACRRAAVDTVAAAPLPAGAADDAAALAEDQPLAAALRAIFRDGGERLQHEACLRLQALDRRLPPSALATALAAGQRSTRLRGALLPVLGERGRWLAGLNPDWAYAGGGDAAAADGDDPARLWQEGSFEQRLQLLRAVRAADPGAARGMLQQQLGELPAKERAEFAAALEVGLSADDEALLAGLLKDRGRDVRRIAAGLLARLPQSAHAQRLLAWLAPLVTQERALLVKRWVVEAPHTADPDWAGAAIETARPQHDALGERAWWLYQLARQAPLAWWCAHTGMSAAQCLAWAEKSDWKAALQRGWLERVGAEDPDWIVAMLEAPGRAFQGEHARLLAMLPAAERVRHWPRSFEQLWRHNRHDEVIDSCAPGQSLPADYSRAIVEGLYETVERDRLRHDWNLRPVIQSLVEVLHPQALREWRALPRSAEETAAMSECLLAVERTVALRRLLHA